MFSLPIELFGFHSQTRHHGASRRKLRKRGAPLAGTRLSIEQLEDKRMLAANPFMLGDEYQVNAFTDGNQTNADVAMDDAGNMVVAWQTFDGNTSGIYAQRYAADGSPLGSEFPVNELELDVYNEGLRQLPAVAMNDLGNFVVTWQVQHATGSYDVYAQQFAADGTPLGSEIQVSTRTDPSYLYPDVAIDVDGDFMVTWNQINEDVTARQILGQRYAADGTSLGGEFQANTYTANHQQRPTVAVDDAGIFVVAWESIGQDGSDRGIYARRYAAGVSRAGGFPGGFAGSDLVFGFQSARIGGMTYSLAST